MLVFGNIAGPGIGLCYSECSHCLHAQEIGAILNIKPHMKETERLQLKNLDLNSLMARWI